MAQVLLKASAYVFVIALGYILKRLRFFKPDDYKLILKITLNITMPAAVITNFAAFEFDFSLLFAVLLALGNVKEVGAVVDRPKALGDIRGVTYIYGMFYRFGLIDVPDDAKRKMNKNGCVSKG